MATFLNDTFTEASGAPLLDAHVGETGATWTKHPNAGTGTVTVPSAIDRARGATSGGMLLYTASGSPAGANYDVDATFVFVTDTTAAMGVVGRATASGQTDHYLAWYDQNVDQWELWAIVAGTATLLGTHAQTLSAGTYALKLEMRGTAIKVYIDGVLRISVNDSSISAAGKAGLRARGSATNTTGLHIDAMSATDGPATVNGGVLDLIWDLKSRVDGLALDLTWDVAVPVSGSALDFVWDLKSRIDGPELECSWDLSAQVSGTTLDIVWDMEARVHAAPLRVVFDTRAIVERDLNVMWDLRNPVNGPPMTIMWDLVALRSRSLTFMWDLLVQVAPRWDVEPETSWESTDESRWPVTPSDRW